MTIHYLSRIRGVVANYLASQARDPGIDSLQHLKDSWHIWRHLRNDTVFSCNLRCLLIFLHGRSRTYRVASLRAGPVGRISYNLYFDCKHVWYVTCDFNKRIYYITRSVDIIYIGHSFPCVHSSTSGWSNDLKFKIPKKIWGGAHRAPSSDPPIALSWASPSIRASPSNLGQFAPSIRDRPIRTPQLLKRGCALESVIGTYQFSNPSTVRSYSVYKRSCIL